MIRFVTPLNLMLLVALLLTAGAGLVVIPPGAQLPVHWNIAGEPDGFLPREWALLVPLAITALVWAIMALVNRTATQQQREAGAHMVNVVLPALTGIMLAIVVVTVLVGAGLDINMVQVIAVALGLLLIVLGNVMPKSRPNAFAGIRMRSTLNSEANWTATHRVGGWLTIGGGLVLLVAAFVAPASVLVWWVAGSVLLPLLAATGYSLVLASRGV